MNYKLDSKFRRIIIFLILIQLTSIFLISLENEIYGWDEMSYIINGIDIANKPLADTMRQYIAHERHPLLSWIIAFLTYFDVPLKFYNLISPIFLVIFFILIYKMGEKLYNRDVGLISGLILISIPTVVFMSAKIMTDVPAALLFSASLYFYYLGLKNPKYFLLGGFIGGISIIMKDMNFLLIPILLVYTLVFWKKISLKYYISSFFIGFISALPYFIDNFVRWGNPFFRILHHIDFVNRGVGYKTFPLQDISFSWIIFLPIALGIPIFYLFILNLYKNRKQLFSDIKLKFLLIWFTTLFIIFLLAQKIDQRLSFIFIIPVLLIGSHELITKRKFKIFLLIILLINGFLFYDLIVLQQIKLSESHKEVFSFIIKNIPQNQTIYSNFNPPSLVAWYTNRTVVYSINPDKELKLNYYLYNDNEISPYFINLKIATSLNPQNMDVNSYNIIFKNSLFTLYQRKVG